MVLAIQKIENEQKHQKHHQKNMILAIANPIGTWKTYWNYQKLDRIPQDFHWNLTTGISIGSDSRISSDMCQIPTLRIR